MTTQHAYLVFEPIVLDQVTGPDGSSELLLPGEGQARLRLISPAAPESSMWDQTEKLAYSRFARRQPETMPEEEVLAEWLRLGYAPPPARQIQPVLAQVPGWRACLADANSTMNVALIAADEDLGGIPATAMADILNRLAGDGWQVLHVSEDKSVTTFSHAGAQAGVARIRMLLRSAG